MRSASRAPYRAPALLACAVAITVAVTGCSASSDTGEPASESSGDATAQDGPRPLTGEEAQRLAMMRFANFDAGVRAVRFEVRDSGQLYAVDGWVDFQAWLGYANLQDGNANSDVDPILIAWTKEAVSSHDSAGDEEPPPLPPPDAPTDTDAWISSELTPSASPLHSALKIILMASNDRPDNPLLLQQTDARWLRSDELDGVPVDVLLGPTSNEPYDPETSAAAGDGSDASVRYWIDQDSVLMRMEMRLGNGTDWTVVEFAEAADASFADAFLAAD